MSSFIQVASGRKINPLDPNPDDILIEDIAHALSNMCRFAGHTRQFYSVAEHSVRVSREVPPEQAYDALMHDASEAYLVDIPRPIKHDLFGDRYREIEETLMQRIGEKFGFNSEMTPEIKRADDVLLATEARDLMGAVDEDLWGPWLSENALPDQITTPLLPEDARKAFLIRFVLLKEQREQGSR